MRPLLLSCGVALTVALTPALSLADAPKPAIFTLVFGADENASVQAAQVQSVIDNVIGSSTKYTLADAVTRFDQTGAEQRSDELQKGDEALTFGIKSYVNLDEGLGLESFERAIESYEQSALWVDSNFRHLTKALAMRILVKWAEDPISTRKELLRVLTIDPNTDFPKEWTPPDLALEAQHDREQVPFEVKVSLDVSTDPPSLVYVDGVYKGVAPTSVKELNPGEHYVSLVTPGYEVVQKLVKVDAGSTLTQTLQPTARGNALVSFTNQIKTQFHTPVEIARAKFLGAMSGANEVIVAQVMRAEGQLVIDFHRIGVANGSVLGEVDMNSVPETEHQFRQAVRDAVLQLLASTCTPQQPGQPCGFKPPLIPHFAPSLRGVKIATGAAAATLFVTGVALGVAARVTDGNYVSEVQTASNLGSMRSTIRGEAAAADTLMALGIVGGAAWAWLHFGVPYINRTSIKDAPVLEKDKVPPPQQQPDQQQPQQQPPPQKPPEKKEEDNDPFSTDASHGPPPLLTRLPMPYTAPMLNGWTFGLQGTF